LNIIDYSFETFDDSLVVTSVDKREENIMLKVNLHFEDEEDNYDEKYAEWQIICSGVRNHIISLGNCYSFDFFENSEESALTWEYIKSQCSVSFYGKSENSSEVIGRLYEAHVKTVGTSIPFDKFFNMPSKLQDLVSGGYGLLANAPEPLALAYKEALNKCGISASCGEPIKPKHWDGYEWTENVKPLSIMIFDSSHIIAEHFVFKEILNKTL
jgi:hypothetical protein